MDPQKKKTKKKGDRQFRNRRILLDAAAHAYRGWRSVDSVWTLTTCKAFVGWCHIDKLFPHHRHKINLKNNNANLHYCRDDAFVQRCIEVYHALYGTQKVPRSEASLGICQMVYAELKLGRTVDWRTFKTSKKTTVPTDMAIPAAGLGNNPRDGLGPQKNIVEGLADEDYTWSPSSSSEDSDEEMIPERRAEPEDTPMEEDLPLVVYGEGINEGDMPMYPQPLLSVEPLEARHPKNDEVMRHVQARLQELAEDALDGEIETEEEVAPVLMILPPPSDDPAEVEEAREVVRPRSTSRQIKKFYKAELEMLLAQLAEEDKEVESLRTRTTEDVKLDDVVTLQEIIEAGQIRLTNQKREMEELEAFYLRFNKSADGGSSSNANPLVTERLQTVIEKCQTEEFNLNREKRSVEEARAKLNRLNELKDDGPLDRFVHSKEAAVGVVHVTSASEVEELKKKVASVKRLEQKLEESIRHQKIGLDLRKGYKKYWIANKMNKKAVALIAEERKIARVQIEADRIKWEA